MAQPFRHATLGTGIRLAMLASGIAVGLSGRNERVLAQEQRTWPGAVGVPVPGESSGETSGVRFSSPDAPPHRPSTPRPARATAPPTTKLQGVDLDRNLIEQRLRLILGSRLHPTSKGLQRTYQLLSRQEVVATLIFDERRAGILVEATPAVHDQLAELFRALAQPTMAGANTRTAVLSIERTDRSQLRQAVDAYRSSRSRLAPAPRNSQVPVPTTPNFRDQGDINHPKYWQVPTTVDFQDSRGINQPVGVVRQGTERGGPSPPGLSRSSGSASTSTGGLALVNFVFQQEGATPPQSSQPTDPHAAQDVVTPAAPPAEATGGLDVDVDVQTLPDLDVIILRGRDRDVQRMTEIIQELDRLSRETQPQVRVYPLEHANAAAVVEVLEDVGEDLTGRRQGRVRAISLIKPNAILLIGWGEAVEALVELIRQLDTFVTADSQFRVYRLRHASATTVATSLSQFFAGREGLGTRIQALPDPRSNSVIVYASPRDLVEADRLIESLDTANGEAVSRAKVVMIRNALAEDIAATLREAIQSAPGQEAPSPILELLTIDGEHEQLVRSGILDDVRFTVNARNNSIVLSGPPDSLPLLEALIQQLDVVGSVSQIKVFRIANGDAANLVRMLRSLVPTETGASPGQQLPSATGETSFAPLRFSVDSRTNSIIATGSDGDLRIIEALLLRLDERDLAERRNEVYRLKNSPALDVALAINEFLRSERVVQAAAPGAESPFEQIEREVVVVPEPVGNSLIISATPRYFDEIKKLVIALDAQPPQVLIQVVIAEVILHDGHEFGIELGLQDSVLFDRSLLGDLVTTVQTTQGSTPAGIVTSTQESIQAATNTPGFDFNNRPLGNSGSTKALARSGVVGSQGLTSFAVGRVNNELGFGGLVLSASSESVSVLIRALQESRRLDVLSRPQVRTLDNQPAFIQVGQRVPRIVASNITEGGLQTNSVELENVGLILGVTPRISPDGTVVMEIDAEKSAIGPEQEGIPITVSLDGTVIRAPRIDTTTAQATVSAASGETIILGGMITKSKTAISRRVPYLSDVPLLGELFRYDAMLERRAELLIILTPHVIRSQEDSQRLNQTEMARMSWCAADLFSMHGDVYTPINSDPDLNEPTEVIYPDINPRGAGMMPPDPGPAEFDRPELPPPDDDEY